MSAQGVREKATGELAQFLGRVEELQQQLRVENAELRTHEPGTSGYDAQVTAVLKATAALVEYEAALPEPHEDDRWRMSARVVVGVGAGLAAVMAVLCVLAISGSVHIGWLGLAGPLVVLGLAMFLAERKASPNGHRDRRNGAAVVAAAGVGAVLLVSGLLPVWWLALVVPAALAGVALLLHGMTDRWQGRAR